MTLTNLYLQRSFWLQFGALFCLLFIGMPILEPRVVAKYKSKLLFNHTEYIRVHGDLFSDLFIPTSHTQSCLDYHGDELSTVITVTNLNWQVSFGVTYLWNPLN